MNIKTNILLIIFLFLAPAIKAQPGSASEPIRYIGDEVLDPDVHEGRLRYAVGTESFQTIRVNQSRPDLGAGQGWTYNHASSLCYWNGKFYQQYLSNPVDEHIEPGQTLITTSVDGRIWLKPVVVFPPYEAPEGVEIPEGSRGYMMHQRMGFYVAPGNRLLVLAFYGHAEDPFHKGGIGRVVREAYPDGSYGPIYFIRYSSHTSWNETNTSYPFYTKSTDKGFVAACDALLADNLKTMQWWDEDQGLDGFYSIKEAGSAFSYYKRKDGKYTAMWKRSVTALSDDGVHFSKPVKSPTLVMAGGKMWGQRTDDSRYAICYNPIELDEHRYPLIVISGDDGITFDNMVLVQGEVPPRRYMGRWKDFGPCYVRGIVQGNGNPPGNDMWLTYSMNKEDMWVSRIPLPVKYAVKGEITDDFNSLVPGGAVNGWNIYSPLWAPVRVADFPSLQNKSLMLSDRDPADYARAIRVVEEAEKTTISMKVMTIQEQSGLLEIDLTDQFGNRPVRLKLEDGGLHANEGTTVRKLQPYKANNWYTLKIEANCNKGTYNLYIEGNKVLEEAAFAEEVSTIERASFRTGPYRDLPKRETPNQDPAFPLQGCEIPVEPATYYIDDFSATKWIN